MTDRTSLASRTELLEVLISAHRRTGSNPHPEYEPAGAVAAHQADDDPHPELDEMLAFILKELREIKFILLASS